MMTITINRMITMMMTMMQAKMITMMMMVTIIED